MNEVIDENCPRCGLPLQPENRLIIEICGHKKCKRCFLADLSKCRQCLENITTTTTAPTLKPVTKTPSPISNRNGTTKNKTITSTRKHSQIAQAKHIKEHISETGEKQYECTVCSKQFKSRSQIYYHISCGKDGIKKYKCTHCDKAFSSKSHLCYHAISHKNESHICAQCGKKFSNIVVLSKHKKLHNNAGQRCTECGKLYRNSLSLAAHKAQHHNIYNSSNNKNQNNNCDMRVFKCNLCEKEYFQKSTLRQHMLKHYGKRFECQVCNKFFQRNSTLQRHLKRHAQRTESFVCTECFRNFSDLGSLLRHAKIHKGDMQYKCRHCHITSVRKDNMLRHVRNIHTGKKFQECVEEIKNYTEKEIQSDKTNETNTSTNDHMYDDNYDNRDVPKTVANSSVIKFVGNVEPMKIPAIAVTTTTISPTKPPIAEIEGFNDPEALYSNAATVQHKKLKKKYDPIEMYRKILISDDFDDNDCNNSAKNIKNIETNTNDNNGTPSLVKAVCSDAVMRNNTLNTTSIFSATHWRKNFKYTYEYRE